MTDGTMSEDNTAEDRRDRYESVLRAVEYQTGGPNSPSPQPAGARQSTVAVTLAAHGQWTPDGVRRSVRAAVENGDLFRWLDGTQWRLARTDADALREVIAEQNQRETPNTELIERVAAVM